MRVSRKGLPATEEALDNTRPILARLDPFLRNLTPILDYVGLYKGELAAFFANDAAATQATDVGFSDSSQQIHYLRTTEPHQPRDDVRLAEPPGHEPLQPVHRAGRLPQARHRGPPRGLRQLPLHLEPDARLRRRRSTRTTRPCSPTSSTHFVFGVPENVGKAPPCDPQAPLGNIVNQSADFPHLQPLP